MAYVIHDRYPAILWRSCVNALGITDANSIKCLIHVVVGCRMEVDESILSLRYTIVVVGCSTDFSLLMVIPNCSTYLVKDTWYWYRLG